LLRRGACHRARIRAIRWLFAMTSRLGTPPKTKTEASLPPFCIQQ
jgi:hypothetical protein